MMNTGIMGKAMLITFAELGVEIDNIDETVDNLTLYISVPKDSYHKDAHGYVMASHHLAKRLKNKLSEMGIKRLSVKYRIRDEVWADTMGKDAAERMKQYLLGSQW